MKAVVIYYSYEENCALIADKVAAALKADVFRIRTVDTKKREGLAKYVWGGSQVLFRKKPVLQPLTVDIQAYDLVVLGSPVWAGSPAAPVFSFLSDKKITGKKIALFCTYAGNTGKVFEKLKVMLPGNDFAGEIGFADPAKKEIPGLDRTIGKWVSSLGV